MTLLTLPAIRIFPVLIATVLIAVYAAASASAQVAPSATQATTSSDRLLTLVMSSTNLSDATGVNNTYTWTAVNNSTITALTGVTLGSHWGDWCGGPPDYTVYSFYNDPKTGVPINAAFVPMIRHSNVVAPAATDIQITGSASNGAPPAGSTFAYTFQIKNAGPWGTYGGITFIDTLPDSLTFVSASVSLRSLLSALACNVQGQTVTCPLSEMQNGGASGQATITLTVIASSSPQQIVNTASALTALPQTDSNTTNNSVTVTVISR
jgi:uncharacterized repeat protein (TIGR01451 family)